MRLYFEVTITPRNQDGTMGEDGNPIRLEDGEFEREFPFLSNVPFEEIVIITRVQRYVIKRGLKTDDYKPTITVLKNNEKS